MDLVDERQRYLEVEKLLYHLVALNCVESGAEVNEKNGCKVRVESGGDMSQHPLCPTLLRTQIGVGPAVA